MSNRDEFEAAVCELAGGGLGRPFPRDDDGNYHAELQSMWLLWQAARRWRSIEEAPKQNPRCLTYTPECNDPDDAVRVCPSGLIRTHSEATHWMPLPEPPNE